MHYTEYFTLRDCSGFLQIRSHIGLRFKRFSNGVMLMTKELLHTKVLYQFYNTFKNHTIKINTLKLMIE